MDQQEQSKSILNSSIQRQSFLDSEKIKNRISQRKLEAELKWRTELESFVKILGGKEREFSLRFDDFQSKQISGTIQKTDVENFKKYIVSEKNSFEGFRLHQADN